MTAHISLRFFIVLMAAVCLFGQSSLAQSQLENMRFSRMMAPVDPVTLKSEGIEVSLWGIKPASTSETQLELRALELLQNTINNQDVTCKVMSASDVTKPSARCSTSSGEDLSLKLLEQGLVVRDRRALYGSVFAASYQEAEELARRNLNGIWQLVPMQDQNFIHEILQDEQKLAMAVLLLVLLPFLATVVLGFIIVRSVGKLEQYKSEDAKNRYSKEQDLFRQEKRLILKKIEGEVLENKSRVEAFLTVYMEMLSNIKDPEVTPQYQKSGDIVSLQPNFERNVFDENVNKLSSLDMRLASDLGQFYTRLGGQADYIDLDNSTPREEAISIIDKIVSDAREFLPMFDQVLGTLQSHMRTDNF